MFAHFAREHGQRSERRVQIRRLRFGRLLSSSMRMGRILRAKVIQTIEHRRQHVLHSAQSDQLAHVRRERAQGGNSGV